MGRVPRANLTEGVQLLCRFIWVDMIHCLISFPLHPAQVFIGLGGVHETPDPTSLGLHYTYS